MARRALRVRQSCVFAASVALCVSALWGVMDPRSGAATPAPRTIALALAVVFGLVAMGLFAKDRFRYADMHARRLRHAIAAFESLRVQAQTSTAGQLTELKRQGAYAYLLLQPSEEDW